MGQDHQPKHQQRARSLQRRKAHRQAYERLLIVCEGAKTEPQYLTEICQEQRLSTAHVHVQHSGFGTEALQVVKFAEQLFRHGDRARGLEAKAFDRLYVVFDRDEHPKYHAALACAESLSGRLVNDERASIPVHAIASVPCFELWLLLHFEDVQAPLHRKEVFDRLRVHLPRYDKGQVGQWACTKALLSTAMQRATLRAIATSARDGRETFTDMGRLVQALLTLKGPN